MPSGETGAIGAEAIVASGDVAVLIQVRGRGLCAPKPIEASGDMPALIQVQRRGLCALQPIMASGDMSALDPALLAEALPDEARLAARGGAS